MSPDPITVDPSTSVRAAGDIMRSHGLRHLPVTDGLRLVGMVSDRDLRADGAALERLAARSSTGGEESGLDRGVELVMSGSPHVVRSDQPIEAAARVMLSHRINSLPVVDDGSLVGIITTTDCLLALLSSAGQTGPGTRHSGGSRLAPD